jgi:GR25 family glycosyltransferase involved in LPS biosynthesis/glycosyltransferase involved in cell wall biosynthesis
MTTVTTPQTLCLIMIVKDESHIIAQTLTHLLAVFPQICYWVIDDTGSTDGTQDLIRSFFAERGISGELYETPWRDFGWNRTQAFEHAFNKTDYVLVWDADDSVVGTVQLPSQLTADAYLCTFGESDGFRYKRLQIFNNRRHWRYVGVLHEYPSLTDEEAAQRPAAETDLPGDYYFISGRTGARNKDPLKYAKDAAVFEQALVEEPQNVRYMFYCANSYMNAGDPDNAIRWFKKRVAAGGWAEEQYVSAYEAGCQYKKKGDMANAVHCWLEAGQYAPGRGEALFELVKYYREMANWPAATLFYERLAVLTAPKDALFSKNAVYGYLRDYEYSIIAFYTKAPIDHRWYLNLLSSGYNTQSALSNYKFYIRKLRDLPGVTDVDFTGVVEKTVAGRTDTFRSSSPCLIPWNRDGHDGYLLNIRHVNYRISSQGAYEFRHADGKITTLNRLLWLSRDLRPVREHWFDKVANPHLRYQGVEDVRLFCQSTTEPPRFVGVIEHPTKGLISVGHGIYDLSASCLIPSVYESPTGNSCEKNWIFADADRLIYNWSPLTISSLADGRILSRDSAVPPFFSLLRGSTCGTHVEDELWFVCHFVEYSTPRHYNHIVVALDRVTLKYRRHSAAFKFHGDPIEYCLGLVVESDRVLFSYSRWDRSSAILSVPRVIFEQNYFGKALTPPVYVVNLDRRPDRLTTITHTLTDAGLTSFHRFPAIDGRTLTVTPELRTLFGNNQFGSRRGIIGCALSHYRIWQQVATDPSIEYITVLEDDVQVNDNFGTALPLIIERCRTEGIDLLFLGFSTQNPAYRFERSVSLTDCVISPFIQSNFVGGAYGYILSRNGACRYLDKIAQGGIPFAIDMLFPTIPHSIRVCNPMIVYSDFFSDEKRANFDSDIQLCGDILDLS